MYIVKNKTHIWNWNTNKNCEQGMIVYPLVIQTYDTRIAVKYHL